MSQPRRGACALLTPEGRTGERKANKRDPLGRRSSPKPGRSSKNRSRGGMPPALPPLSAPFAPARGRPGRGFRLSTRPLFHSVVLPSFCGRRSFACFSLRGQDTHAARQKPPRGFSLAACPGWRRPPLGRIVPVSPPGSAGVVRRKTAAAGNRPLDIMEAGQEKARQEKRQQKREREKARERDDFDRER